MNKMHDEGKKRAEFNIRDVHIIQGHRIRPRTKLNHGLNSCYLGNKNMSMGVQTLHSLQAVFWNVVSPIFNKQKQTIVPGPIGRA